MRTLLWCGALALLFAGVCAGYMAGAQDLRTLKPGQVARVGESVITAEQFLQRLNEAEKLMLRPDRRVEGILDLITAERMLDLEAARGSVTLAPEELQAEFDALMKEQMDSFDAFNRQLRESQRRAGQPEQVYTWPEFLRDRLGLTDAEFATLLRIRARNDLMKRLVVWYWFAATPNVNARLIHCSRKERIDEVQRRLARGDSFESLVVPFSEHPSASQPQPGMLAELFAGDGTLELAVDKALWQLKDGQASGPIESGSSWYIVQRVKTNLINEAPMDKMRGELLARPNVRDNLFLKWRNAIANSGRYVYERRMPGLDCAADE